MTVLKRDLFGVVTLTDAADDGRACVRRDTRAARWWLRPLAQHLARREAHALARLDGLDGVPRLLGADSTFLEREWIPGTPMQTAGVRDARYFRNALHLVRRMHTRHVAHNDLAKEPNWLVRSDGRPALVDFQLSLCTKRRGLLFRMLAHDDLRHLYKHKRTYLPHLLTARQRRVLATPSLVSQAWRRTGKPVYLFVTRRLLRWADREGAGDRQFRA